MISSAFPCFRLFLQHCQRAKTVFDKLPHRHRNHLLRIENRRFLKGSNTKIIAVSRKVSHCFWFIWIRSKHEKSPSTVPTLSWLAFFQLFLHLLAASFAVLLSLKLLISFRGSAVEIPHFPRDPVMLHFFSSPIKTNMHQVQNISSPWLNPTD